MENKTTITVSTTVQATIEKAWEYSTLPRHIKQWNNASDDWHTPHAENDLRTGGKFLSRMEARDGSFGFDFGGTYDMVTQHKAIHYTIGDGRKVHIRFTDNGAETKIEETFDPENQNSMELQRGGWQAILDNFKKYTERG
jgi:uncharacterized protein YndB with AHSA1/START domain